MTTIVSAGILVSLYAVSMYTDIKYKKIKNVVTMPAIAVGIFLLSFQHGLFHGIRLFVIGLMLGLLLEVFRIWASGDTKLFVAGGLSTLAIVQSDDFSVLFYFFAANLFMYLLVGHAYTLWISKFRIKEYFHRLRSHQPIGKIAGAVPICISNMFVLGVYFIVTRW